MKALVWHDEELGAKFDIADIPAELQDAGRRVPPAELHRRRLAATTTTILEKSSATRRSPPPTSSAPSATATIDDGLVPVLTGSAFKNKGVQPLLDAVVDYLPVAARPPAGHGHEPQGQRGARAQADAGEPFAALAFKIVADPHGKLTYFRVYSGTLDKGGPVLNSRTGQKERVGRLLLMHANQREDLDAVSAGDIVAGIGLKNTRTGDTLCDREEPDRPRGARVPRAGHPRRRRAEDQGRPGQDGQGPLLAVRGGPDLPGPHRRGDRPDRHLRHGRAAPRGPRRPHAARVQRRRHRRQAAGRLPRDDHPAGREGRVPPHQADRWLGPVRRRRASTSSPTGPGGGY